MLPYFNYRPETNLGGSAAYSNAKRPNGLRPTAAPGPGYDPLRRYQG